MRPYPHELKAHKEYRASVIGTLDGNHVYLLGDGDLAIAREYVDNIVQIYPFTEDERKRWEAKGGNDENAIQ